MRRKDREITDLSEIESIIRRSTVCRLAFSDQNQPYIVPLSFGYKDNRLYFHSAPKGRKIDMLKKNSRVCFEFDIDYEIIKADKACDWGMRYKSVIGFGKASFVEGAESKRRALEVIMAQYADGAFSYPDNRIKNTVVIQVEIEHMSGKRSE
ncbi:pyridoxamine 5'-phosphate oxidase family protein [Thermodesulfobacteriota bacterium]